MVRKVCRVMVMQVVRVTEMVLTKAGSAKDCGLCTNPRALNKY